MAVSKTWLIWSSLDDNSPDLAERSPATTLFYNCGIQTSASTEKRGGLGSKKEKPCQDRSWLYLLIYCQSPMQKQYRPQLLPAPGEDGTPSRGEMVTWLAHADEDTELLSLFCLTTPPLNLLLPPNLDLILCWKGTCERSCTATDTRWITYKTESQGQTSFHSK